MAKLLLEKMSQEVFNLDNDDLKILKHLSINGPLNLTHLSRHTSKYASGLERWAVKKHLQGTTRFLGLIPNDYVVEEKTNLKRFNKQESKYWLTVKGIIASTIVVPLRNNKLFQEYCEKIASNVGNYKIKPFIEKAIEDFIRLIIAFHYLQGIQLTKQKSSKFYYLEFLEQIRRINGIDVTITNKEIDKEFICLVKNCIENYTVMDLLTGGNMNLFATTLSLVDWSKTKEQKEDFKYRWYDNIWEWPLHLGNPNFHKDTLPILVKSDFIRTEVTIDEMYSKNMKSNVNAILKSIDYREKWKSKI